MAELLWLALEKGCMAYELADGYGIVCSDGNRKGFKSIKSAMKYLEGL